MALFHPLSVCWTLISILIVSHSPSRSSSLSTPASYPLSSSRSTTASSLSTQGSKVHSSWREVRGSSGSGTTPPSSTVIAINSNQYPSMFSSFNFLHGEKHDDESSFEKSASRTRIANIISINRPSSQLSPPSSASRRLVFNSVTGDTDKSDNQISSHNIVPFPPRRTNNKLPLEKHKYNISVTSSRRARRRAASSTKNKSTRGYRNSGGSSAGIAPFSLSPDLSSPKIASLNRPKRQLHQQRASSSSSTSVATAPPELTSTRVPSSRPQNTTASGRTAFIGTSSYPDQTVSEPVLTMPSAASGVYSVRSRSSGGGKRRVVRVEEGNQGADKTLTILGLFELTQNSLARESGRSEKIAAEMALEDINAKGILHGYRLTMHTNDTQCDPGTGVDAFFHALYSRKESKFVSLLGTACSEVTERLAKVATRQHIIQVSFGSTSPSLSDKKEFPLFYRTVAPVSSHAEAIIELIRHFQWDTVTFFTKNENRYTMPANFLLSELEKTNVRAAATLTFSISDYRDQLQDMKELDSRIIIANFGSDVAPLVFCEIYRMGMYGSDYAWILIGEPETDWWLDSPSSPTSSRNRALKPGKILRKRELKSESGGTSRAASSPPTPTTVPSDDDDDYYTSTQRTPGESVVGREFLSYGDQSYSAHANSRTADSDPISIKMGSTRAFTSRNKVSTTSESGSGISGFNRNRNNSYPSGSSTFSGRLNSSSNPGTLRLKSSGKSLYHEQHSLHHHHHHHQSDCSFKQLMEAVQYAIVVDRYNILEKPSDSGMTTGAFRRRLLEKLKASYNTSSDNVVSPFAPETYDAVWTVALGLQKVQEKYKHALDNFTRESENFSQLLKNEIGMLNFSGISGPITFAGSDRIGITSFMQIQDGEMVQVGLLFPDRSSNKLELDCKGCKKIRWHGNQVPISRREFRFKLIRVEYSLYIIVATAASLGIVMAAAFLAFNLYHRKLKYIKLSSPKLNNIVIIGCIFAYAAVILLGTDFTAVPDGKHFAYLCTIRAYLLSMAFSLAFGAMFAKTYRVYRIFTRSCIGVVKNKLLRDTQLMTLIMALVLIDCITVSSWALFDPMHVKLLNLTVQIDPSDRTVAYQPQIEVCLSQRGHVWLSALYGYKSLLLVVGLYMAWETRHVKIQALNDSKYIGLCVYIVVLTSVLAVSLANLISERVTLSFVSVTSLILFSTTVTLCLLFLPKIHAITKNQSTSDPVVESMGLKIECNTRRFIVEDTKELLFRAEVQNRVYKRQIECVDAEIWRLENLLVYSPSKQHHQTASCSTNEATTGSKNAKGVNKKGRRKSGTKTGDCSTVTGEDGESSSEDNDSNSEIYTVYLHGPRFIVPISLFNFRGANSPCTYTSARIEDSLHARVTATSSAGSAVAPRQSWPNSRYLAPPTNGLVAKKYRFKSEPRLQVESCPGGRPHPVQRGGLPELTNSAITPPTIIQWGDTEETSEVVGESRENLDFGISSGGSSNASCNNIGKSNSRKGSSVSSKRSSIFAAFKNPWAYLTGFMKQSGNTQGSSYSGPGRGNYSPNEYYQEGSNPNDNCLLKPMAYFDGHSSSHRQKFSSVPDLWAVRGSPDFDVNHKKHSINSDTAAVGVHVINPSSSHELADSNPNPVLKLIVTSHESVYL